MSRLLLKYVAVLSICSASLMPGLAFAESDVKMTARPTATATATTNPLNQNMYAPLNQGAQQLNKQWNESIDKTGQSMRSITSNATSGTVVSPNTTTDTTQRFQWSWLGLLGLIGLFGLFKPKMNS